MTIYDKVIKTLNQIDGYDNIGRSFQVGNHRIAQRYDGEYVYFTDKSPLQIKSRSDIIDILSRYFAEGLIKECCEE